MPEWALYALASAVGYLAGSIPFGLVITRAAGLGDIRAIGSGNIGATNVLRTGRKDLALATLLLDSLKAGLAAFAFTQVAGREVGFVAGAAAFIGHCYPVWLNFKGGKGVATFFGVLLAGLPLVGVAAGAIWILTALTFRMSSLAALTAAAAAPFLALFLHDGPWGVGFCLLIGALIFWRHHANIDRILKGQEPKIGAKSAAPAAPDPAP
jgi:glycerol-3-phosphate acyltransferase PlsY